MYERFTDRARKVMQLANQEAQRLNHEYIGTEHILLGLVREGSGIAANALKNLDVDLRKIRLEVEKLIHSGPEMVTMGRLPFTPRAKLVIEHAMEEARNLNHNYVGTEHLLLGLIRESEGVASLVLTSMGLTAEKVRREILGFLGQVRTATSDGVEQCLIVAPVAPVVIPVASAVPPIPRRAAEITVGEIRYILGRDDPLIIEVGCNDGETTAKMLAVMPRATIICFEPDPRPLTRNTAKDDKRVIFRQLAISHRAGKFPFIQSGGSVPNSTAPCKDDWDYSGSLCKPTGHLDRDKLVTFPTTIEVETERLDDAVLGDVWGFGENRIVDLIFADVQGAEARLILGGQQTLRRTRYFYCEFYDIEQYERQPDLKGLLSFLPDWDLIAVYGGNALFRNREMEGVR